MTAHRPPADAGTPAGSDRPAFRPPATAHDGLQGKWRWGWLFSAIWLVYLYDTLIAAAQNRDLLRAVIGVAAVLLFSLLYVWAFGSVRDYRRAGRLVPNRLRVGVISAAFGLFLVAGWVAGEQALAMLVFIAVMVMFIIPLRSAIAVILLLVAIAEIGPRVVPGWAPIDSLGFQIAVTALAMWGITQLVQRNAELAAAQKQLAELAVTNERTRFARDLHDVLGHSLTVLTVKAELAGRLVRLDPERAEQEIGEVERLGRDALADVRAAVAGYRGANLAAELVSARAALDAAGIEAALPSAVDEVPGERRELLGWAVREGVTNVLRHSGARHCWIRLTPSGVEITDDGRGPGGGQVGPGGGQVGPGGGQVGPGGGQVGPGGGQVGPGGGQVGPGGGQVGPGGGQVGPGGGQAGPGGGQAGPGGGQAGSGVGPVGSGSRQAEPGVGQAEPGGGQVGLVEVGHGLTGLRERAEAAGASLVLGRAEEGGFRMRVGW